jgi:CO dehydrogenase/acetyl-CoA synthase epsilon subunit
VKVSVLCPAVVNTRIGESERNRPEDLHNKDAAGVPSEQMQMMEQAFRALLATGLPTEEVAERVVEAIREERFYIITHEETKERVRTRMEDILEARNPTLLPMM